MVWAMQFIAFVIFLLRGTQRPTFLTSLLGFGHLTGEFSAEWGKSCCKDLKGPHVVDRCFEKEGLEGPYKAEHWECYSNALQGLQGVNTTINEAWPESLI